MSTERTQYIVQLKDLASRAFGRMGAAGNAAFSRVQNMADRANGSINRMPASIQDLNRRLDELRRQRSISVDSRQVRQLGDEITRVERQLDRVEGRSRTGGGLGAILPSPGAMAAMLGVAGVGSFLNEAINQEAQKIKLGVLAGGQAQGDQLFGSVKSMAAATPFGSADLLDVTGQLKAFGVANENVLPSLKMLGDVAGGDAQRLKSLGLAFGQVMSAGKMTGQDLMQMINQGFNPLQEISEATGESMVSLKDRMSEGSFSALEMVKAFELATGAGGRFDGMMEKMSKTTAGQLSTVKDNVMETGAGIMTQLLPAVNGLLQTVQFLLNYKEVVITMGLAWLAYSKAQAVATLATRIFSGSMIGLRAVLIATGVGAIAAAIGMLWNLGERMKKAGVTMEELKNITMSYGGVVKNTFQLMWENVSFTFERMWLKAKIVWEKIKGLFTGGDASVSEGLLAQLEKAHEARLKSIKSERDLNILAGKEGLQGVAAKMRAQKASEQAGGFNTGLMAGGGDMAALADEAAGGAGALSSGGPRSIVVNIGKFQDAINIYTSGVEEGLDELDRKITEVFLRVVNSGAALN
jgi:tape measure domain-containing protein